MLIKCCRILTNQVDLLSLGFNVGQVGYERKPRPFGKSQYTFAKKFKVALNQLLSTSYWPLRMASSIGFITTILGFLYAIRITHGYFFRDMPFRGWAPIMILQLIIGGMILFMLGIIGEYLWRIYHESKRRPLYFIDEIYEGNLRKEQDD